MFNGGMYHSQTTSAVQDTVTYLQGTTLRLSTTHPIHIGYIGATLSKSATKGVQAFLSGSGGGARVGQRWGRG